MVANVDSIGLVVRKWLQCSAGKSENVSKAYRSFFMQLQAGVYFAPYFSKNASKACSALAFASACQI